MLPLPPSYCHYCPPLECTLSLLPGVSHTVPTSRLLPIASSILYGACNFFQRCLPRLVPNGGTNTSWLLPSNLFWECPLPVVGRSRLVAVLSVEGILCRSPQDWRHVPTTVPGSQLGAPVTRDGLAMQPPPVALPSTAIATPPPQPHYTTPSLELCCPSLSLGVPTAPSRRMRCTPCYSSRIWWNLVVQG